MNINDYIDDVFTKVDDKINIDANNLNINCITSKNNKFSLDSDGNLIVNSITSIQNPNHNIEQIADLIYPVGSIYMSVTNINPSTLFGGIWEQIKDRFLLGAGDTYKNGITGGEANHTLTADEMPSHIHNIPILYGTTTSAGEHIHGESTVHFRWKANANKNSFASTTKGNIGADSELGTKTYTDRAGAHTHNITTTASKTESLGGSKTHNNMPPYLTVYMYKRVS